ncbi:MAG: hypothetical protein WEB59_07695 [Thermoanaerobaculia bacterium]
MPLVIFLIAMFFARPAHAEGPGFLKYLPSNTVACETQPCVQLVALGAYDLVVDSFNDPKYAYILLTESNATAVCGHTVPVHERYAVWAKDDEMSHGAGVSCDQKYCWTLLGNGKIYLANRYGNPDIVSGAGLHRDPNSNNSLEHLPFLSQLVDKYTLKNPVKPCEGDLPAGCYYSKTGRLGALVDEDAKKTWHWEPAQPATVATKRPLPSRPARGIYLDQPLSKQDGVVSLWTSKGSLAKFDYRAHPQIRVWIASVRQGEAHLLKKGEPDYDFLLHYQLLKIKPTHCPVPVPDFEVTRSAGGSDCFGGGHHTSPYVDSKNVTKPKR